MLGCRLEQDSLPRQELAAGRAEEMPLWRAAAATGWSSARTAAARTRRIPVPVLIHPASALSPFTSLFQRCLQTVIHI